MKWLWPSIVIVLYAITFLAVYYNSRKRHEQRFELQFWDKAVRPEQESCWENYQIHFPSMILRYRLDCIGGPHAIRFYHVQRNVDGSWEMKLTDKSWSMDMKEQEQLVAKRSGLAPSAAEHQLEQMKAEGNNWRPMSPPLYDPSLETAYQRFIHTPDITVAPLTWMEEEEKEEQLLAMKLGHKRSA